MNMIRALYERILQSLRMRRYDEWTIENYLRGRGFRIGSNNRLYTRDFGTEPYLIKIGSHCTITVNVQFITHDGGAWVFRQEMPELNSFGTIEIKDNCFIGANSILLPNITIGPNSVVGAGSVVTKDVPPNSVAAGTPARVICSLEEYKEKTRRRWEALGLTGPRAGWEKQLIEHFWGREELCSVISVQTSEDIRR
jgi:acetyltransferase-like isoleucine patch superfamily enzyme